MDINNYAGIFLNEQSSYEITQNPNSSDKVAEIFYNKVIDQKGWNKLSINTYSIANSYEQAFFAGYLEGRISATEIYNFFYNLRKNMGKHYRTRFNELLKFFDDVARNFDIRIINSIDGFDDMTDEDKNYWSKIILGYAQIEGLMRGYNYAIEKVGKQDKMYISLSEFFMIQADAEIHELMRAIKAKKLLKRNNIKIGDKKYFEIAFGIKTKDPIKFWKELMKTSRCSAFIKIVKDENNNWKDLLAGHTTWSDYSELLRIYKQYLIIIL